MSAPDDSFSEEELVLAAHELGRLLRPGDAVLLFGAMGAGKTTFTRALARGLGVTRPDRVCSPTFNLLLVHPGAVPLVHVDLCRLGELGGDDAPSISSAAFEALGLGELADELASGAATRVIAVEWAELWADPPASRLEVRLSSCEGRPERRRLALQAHGPRADELARQWRDTGKLGTPS
jgi:tRNA threonylcarbamoyladenosine biosynthesis protein TsaE